VEHLLYLSSVAIHVILASHPIHFIFHLQSKVLQGPTSHAGFEKITAGTESENGLAIGDFFHQLHHRYFECNYGEPDIPFDEWFGTYHDGTPEGLKHIRSNMKKRGVTRG
jgi:sterol desaturase/sphingolipid hydroxylase (fatty acid hydroxylase superfamily)